MKETDVRQKIVVAAERRFDHYGYKKTTVDEIAADAGISKGAIYMHFKSKEDILLEVMREFSRTLLSKWEEMAKSATLAFEKLDDMVCFLIEAVLNKRNKYFSERLPTDDFRPETKRKYFAEIMPQLEAVLSEVIEKGISEGSIRNDVDINKLSESIFNQIRYSIYMNAYLPEYDWREAWEYLWGLLCKGICKES